MFVIDDSMCRFQGTQIPIIRVEQDISHTRLIQKTGQIAACDIFCGKINRILIRISLKYIPRGLTDNKSSLV